ncbi:MAG: thrC [Rickettsiaceae bacterium]|jgi:threonine synthase|nr:thrC [Rickettsiaceae bacterium]
MKYISTRQQNKTALGFQDILLQGLATDGGLYVPQILPKFSPAQIKEMAKMGYQDLAYKVIHPFIVGEIPDSDLKNIIEKSYKNFAHSAIAPLKQLTHNQYLLELFHGPTLAFKDFALQLLGNLLDYVLKKNNQKIVIIGATSGDTGSAAIMGCKSCQNAEIFILHPYNRVSDVQRRQMTTIADANVHNISLKGNFDDCQSFVKQMFMMQSSGQDFLKGKKMVAVNSINWARIMAQIVYYFYAGLRLGASEENPISFCVPTGNFGDIYAGFLAKKMGLPVKKLIIATNSNDILTRFLNANDYSRKSLIDTLSPSMNIQVSSNFERLLFDYYKTAGKSEKLADLMKEFEKTGTLKADEEILENIRKDFESYSISDQNTCELIKQLHQETGETIDPHSIVGVGAARKYIESKNYSGEPVVILATAHPAKFPEAIEKAGLSPAKLPEFLSGLMDKKERMVVLENNIDDVKSFIYEKI